MKKALIFFCMIIFSISLFSQHVTPNTRYERLMKKSSNKQIGGFIFLTGGAAVTAGGIFLIKDGIHKQNSDESYGTSNYTGLSTGETEQVLGALLTGIGIGGMCTSIPFFVGANRAHKKAMAISAKTESVSLLFKTSISRQFYPALALQIPLGR